jgi:hypothetical protein
VAQLTPHNQSWTCFDTIGKKGIKVISFRLLRLEEISIPYSNSQSWQRNTLEIRSKPSGIIESFLKVPPKKGERELLETTSRLQPPYKLNARATPIQTESPKP